MTRRPVMYFAGALLATALLQADVSAQGRGGGQNAAPARPESYSEAFRGSKSQDWEAQKVAPIKVFDNLYYVGPGGVSVWLISTDAGLIVVDSTQEPLVDHVLNSIRKMGFNPADIRYILITHGHLDHFGGVGKIKAAAPNARIATLAEDWDLIEKFYADAANPAAGRGRGNARDPGIPFKRDMVIKEGDTIRLGKTELKVYKLPGHTAGSPSFSFDVFDNGRPHKAFIFGGPGQRGGVEGGTEFLNSIRRLKKEFGDIEVPVHVHSALNTYPDPRGGTVFEPAMQLAKRQPGQPHPFVVPDLWKKWLDTAEAGTIKYIEDAKNAPPK